MVKLMSNLNHPVRVSLGDDTIVVPPYGIVELSDDSAKKLGAIPRGVFVYRQEKVSDRKSKK